MLGPDRDSAPSGTKERAPARKGYEDLTQITAWDDRGRFVITDSDALASIVRTRLSPSTMKSMKDCTARWAAESLFPRRDDPYAANGQGTAAHKVFERLMQMPPHQRTMYHAHELVNQVARETLGGVDHARALPLAAQILPKVDGLWAIDNPVDLDVVSTEFRAEQIDIEGIPFVGIIDLVTRLTENNVKIIDYKTGALKSASYYKRFGDGYGDQIRLYKLAWEKVHPTDSVTIGTLYHTAEKKQRVIDISDREVRLTLRRWKKAWATLQNVQETGVFETKVDGLCAYCPLVQVCPAARAAGKEPKIAVPDPSLLPMTAEHRAQVAAQDEADNALLGDDIAPLLTTETTDETPNPTSEEPIVKTATTPRLGDGKVWEEKDGPLLNGNSYAAMGLFGLVGMAVEHLGKAGQPITPSNVRALAHTFGKVVLAAQAKVTGSQSWQDGANTRMRGALHTVLDSPDMALPWGGDEAAWRGWALKAVRRSVSIASVVTDLWAGGPDDKPWLPLAATGADLADEDAA